MRFGRPTIAGAVAVRALSLAVAACGPFRIPQRMYRYSAAAPCSVAERADGCPMTTAAPGRSL